MCAMKLTHALTEPGTTPPGQLTLALFCRVVDNYGDIGICWRLARQLRHEHGVDVTLWVDDLASFQRLEPQVALDAGLQQQDGVTVRHWRDQEGRFGVDDIADIVIEFFACDIPEGYIAAMALCEPRPVWLNLEGLTAEEWVEGCHRLPSPHPRLPLTKHFFFPGFTARTGGLLREAALEQGRSAFGQAAQHAFLAQLGVPQDELAALKVSLFCYPHAPVAAMFDAWQGGAQPVLCLVPDGVATEAVQAFLGAAPAPGASARRGALTVRVLPFLPQNEYDKLLWSCGLNFVRGEDSFVRAQWAQKPFIWHIYPQDENLHHKKLRAFLQRYGGAPAGDIDSLRALSLRWNDASAGAGADAAGWSALWQALHADLSSLEAHAGRWQAAMAENGELTGNMLAFAATLRQSSSKTRV